MSTREVISHRLRALFGPRDPVARTLVDCGGCGHSTVCPVEWETAGEDHWWISFRCGECGRRSELVVTNATAAELDCLLAAQEHRIRREAERMEHERMLKEVDAFIAALHRDLIAPADFA
jgi:hypothetical protein